jgi:hypothetical protein
MSGLPEPLARALTCSAGGAAAWSAEDQDRLDRLLGAPPDTLFGSAERLEHLAAQAAEAGAQLRRIGAAEVLGDHASRHCAPLAAAIEAASVEASGLARELRLAANRGEDLLAELVRAVLQAIGQPTGALRRVLDAADRDAGFCPAATGCPDDPVDPGAWSAWPLSGKADHAPVGPGNGPLLGGTEGERPETATGVRVAQLPDAGH